MKPLLPTAVGLVAMANATASLTFTSGFGGSVFHQHDSADAIAGFDWGSDNEFYYMSSTASFGFGGLYRKNGSASQELIAGNSNFSGASVVGLNSSIYYNDSDFSDQFIRRYDIASGNISTSTISNYALASDGSNLINASGSLGTGNTNIDSIPNGDFSSGSTRLGEEIGGATGPVSFDASGNLYYAPGFGDLSVYRWNASDVTAAMTGGPQLTAAGNLWADYSSAFSDVSGGSAMTLDDDGNLYLILTNFAGPSSIVRFSPDGSSSEVIATSDGRLGGIRFEDGELYVSEGNQVVTVIPEPSILLLSLAAIIPFGLRRRQ